MAKATPKVAVTFVSPLAFAHARATPPASAVTSESSVARTVIEPLVLVIVLPLTIASEVDSTRLTDPAAAPASVRAAFDTLLFPGGPPPPAPPPD